MPLEVTSFYWEELQKEMELREQAERKLRLEEEINSDCRRVYNEQVLHTERAEARVEALEDLLEVLGRDFGMTFCETEPYSHPYMSYKTEIR